eukprot:EG_transcript_21718
MCVEREVLPASMAAMRAGRRGAPRMVQHVVRVLHTLHCRQQGAAEAEELVQLIRQGVELQGGGQNFRAMALLNKMPLPGGGFTSTFQRNSQSSGAKNQST